MIFEITYIFNYQDIYPSYITLTVFVYNHWTTLKGEDFLQWYFLNIAFLFICKTDRSKKCNSFAIVSKNVMKSSTFNFQLMGRYDI